MKFNEQLNNGFNVSQLIATHNIPNHQLMYNSYFNPQAQINFLHQTPQISNLTKTEEREAIDIKLEDNELWSSFSQFTNEMILTKSGR